MNRFFIAVLAVVALPLMAAPTNRNAPAPTAAKPSAVKPNPVIRNGTVTDRPNMYATQPKAPAVQQSASPTGVGRATVAPPTKNGFIGGKFD